MDIDINIDNINKAWKYHCTKLTSDSNEHKFVLEFYNTTTQLSPWTLSQADMTIHKIVENYPANKLSKNNLMLFHGTNKYGVQGILKDGFRLI